MCKSWEDYGNALKAEGLEEGFEKGILLSAIKTAKNLIARKNMSKEEAVELTDVPEKYREEVLAAL